MAGSTDPVKDGYMGLPEDILYDERVEDIDRPCTSNQFFHSLETL
jgi:hypothetical protein